MNVELRRLRHLIALAEHGNFGRAAAACYITQPALSRSIQALEAQVGATLFDRRRKMMEAWGKYCGGAGGKVLSLSRRKTAL